MQHMMSGEPAMIRLPLGVTLGLYYRGMHTARVATTVKAMVQTRNSTTWFPRLNYPMNWLLRKLLSRVDRAELMSTTAVRQDVPAMLQFRPWVYIRDTKLKSISEAMKGSTFVTSVSAGTPNSPGVLESPNTLVLVPSLLWLLEVIPPGLRMKSRTNILETTDSVFTVNTVQC